MLADNRISKKKAFYKLIDEHLKKRDYIFDLHELTCAVKEAGDFPDRLYYSVPKVVKKIYKRAIKRGLPYTEQVGEAIERARACDCESFYADLSGVEKILLTNKVYRVSDSKTRSYIRKKLFGYSSRHRIGLTDAAAVFASHPDCNFTPEHTRVRHYHVCLLLSLSAAIPTAVLLRSFWAFPALFFPFLTLISMIYFTVSRLIRSKTPLPRIAGNAEGVRVLLLYVIPSSELDTLQARMERAVFQFRNASVTFGAVITRTPSPHPAAKEDQADTVKLKEIYDRLVERHGDRFRFYIPQRIYDPSTREFVCPSDRCKLLRLVLNAESRGIEIALAPDSTEEPDHTLIADRMCEMSADTLSILVRSATHPLNRPVVEDGVLKRGYVLTGASKRYYIPIRHTFFSYISSPVYTDTFADMAKFFGTGDALPSGCVLVDNEAFIRLFDKGPKELSKGAVICEDAVCFEKTQFSPAAEIAGAACPYGVTAFRRSSKRCNLTRLVSYSNALILPLIALAVLALYPSTAFPADAVLLISALAAFSAYVCAPMLLMKKDALQGIITRTLLLIPKAFLALSLLPLFVLMSMVSTVKALFSYLLQKELGSKPNDSAKIFFAITLSSLGAGILFLTFSGSTLHKLFAFLFLLAPVTVVLLSLETGGGRKIRSALVREQCSRSLAAFREYGLKKSVISDGDKPDGDNSDDGISPTVIGLYMTAALAYCDLELIPPLETYNLLSGTVDALSELPTSDGLFYSSYDFEKREKAAGSAVSASENDMFFTCLIALREGLRETLDDDDSLIVRIDRLILAADMSVLSSLSGGPAPDLSGARFLSACFTGAKYFDHPAYFGKGIPLSDCGRADEVFLPSLFLPVYPATDSERNLRKHYRVNRRSSKKGLWGITACVSPDRGNGKYVFDRNNGIGKLSVGGERPVLYSPYACFMMLPFRPTSVIGELYNYRMKHAFGKYGLYDSVTFSSGRKNRALPIEAYSLQNLCAAVIAADNCENGGIFVRRFSRSEFTNPYLYLLRRKYDRTYGAFRVRSDEIREDRSAARKYSVPGICVITSGLISAAASDEGHLTFFGENGRFTADCFNKYDMGDVSESFEILCCVDGRCFSALQGDFSYSDSKISYLIKSDISSLLEIAAEDCRHGFTVKLTVNGNFKNASCSLSFNAGSNAAVRSGMIVSESGNALFFAKCRNRAAAALSTDGKICEINVGENSCCGVFTCEFSVGLHGELPYSESRAKTPSTLPKSLSEAILASCLLAAGAERRGRTLDRDAYGDLFNKPVVAAIPGKILSNLCLLDQLSSMCARLRRSGIDLSLAVFTDSESAARAVSGHLSHGDMRFTGRSDLEEAARAFSAICFDEEAFSSPERFASDIMSRPRRMPDLIERYSAVQTDPPCNAVRTAYGYCAPGRSVLEKSRADGDAYFSIGNGLKIVSDGSSLGNIYLGDERLTEYIKLSAVCESGEYDVISTSHTVEKNECITVYRSSPGGTDMTVEIFSDDSLPAIIIRIFGGADKTKLYLMPHAPYDDPRLIHEVYADDTVFYHSVCKSAFAGKRLYCAAASGKANERTFIIGLLENSELPYYLASERHALSSGCETPLPSPSSVTVRSSDPVGDYLISGRIPELFSGLFASRGERIFGFPMLALTDTETLKNVIADHASKQSFCDPRSLVLPAAIAVCYAFSDNVDFLSSRVPYSDSAKSETIYTHGLRAIEYFMPGSDPDEFLLAAVADMYKPVSDRMSDRSADEVYKRLIKNTSYSDDPLVNAYACFIRGDYEKGCSLLFRCAPDFYADDPLRVSLYYYVYMFVMIGIEGRSGTLRVRPRLSRAFPEYRLFIRRALTEYAVSARLGETDSTLLDGMPSDGIIVYDGLSHKLDITVSEKGRENS